MRHRNHDPIDPDDPGEARAGDDYTAALKAALWLLGVIALGALLGLYLVSTGR